MFSSPEIVDVSKANSFIFTHLAGKENKHQFKHLFRKNVDQTKTHFLLSLFFPVTKLCANE